MCGADMDTCGATEQNQQLGRTQFSVKVCNLHSAFMVQTAHFHIKLKKYAQVVVKTLFHLHRAEQSGRAYIIDIMCS